MKCSLPVLLVVMTTLLSACGFHLRGSDDGTRFAMKELTLRSENPHSELSRDVTRMLESGGTRVKGGAPWILVLGAAEEARRTASYTPNTRAAEFELARTLPFEIRSSDNLRLYRDTLEVHRTVVRDESNLVGSDEETGRVRREMQAELIRLLALRLHHLDSERLQELAERARAAGTPAGK